MQPIFNVSALVLSLAASSQTFAVVQGPILPAQTEAFTAATASPSSSGQITVTNGVITSNLPSTATTSLGPKNGAATSSSRTDAAGNTFLFGDPTPHAVNLTSTAFADLETGTLRGSVISGGFLATGDGSGFSASMLQDTLNFTNTTGGDLLLKVTYTFDGFITPNETDAFSGFISVAPSLLFIGNGVEFANGPANSNIGALTLDINQNGLNSFREDSGGPISPRWEASVVATNGFIEGFINTTLRVSAGASQLGLRARLNVDCRFLDSCNFGQTARFAFEPLPDGLSFTSDSGTFLSASPVPVPATVWLFGSALAAIGVARRRKQG